MFLDLKRIFITEMLSLPIEYELDLSELSFSGAFPLKKPVKVCGAVENRAGVVHLRLDIRVEYDAACDRCGEDTVRTHIFKVDRGVVESLSGEDTGEYIIAPDMKLDLDETVTGEVVLSLPQKHLCSDTCLGRCQTCGKNLNEGNCSCDNKEIDPRLAALAELLN